MELTARLTDWALTWRRPWERIALEIIFNLKQNSDDT